MDLTSDWHATSSRLNSGIAAALPAAEQISLWGLLAKGGFIMYPLYLLLVAAIFVFFERLIAIRKASSIEGNFMSMIRDNIMTGNLSAARTISPQYQQSCSQNYRQRLATYRQTNRRY
ncbi:MAG: hypothetical protein WKG06_13585 [Segetibacter sp.]